MMVIAVAFILPSLGFAEKSMHRLGWIIILDGWANVIFYLFANFAQNRALTFGANKFGEGDIYSFIGLSGAYLFGVLAIGALFIIGRQAFKTKP